MRVLHNTSRTTEPAKYFGKLIVSALLIYLIARNLDLHALGKTAASLSPAALAGALALQLASNGTAAFRWYLIMRALGFAGTFAFYLRSFFKGAFFNQGLPASIGGDGVRILDAARIAGKREDAFFGVFIDRFIGLAGLLLLNVLAVAISHGVLPASMYVPLLAVMSLLLLALAGLFFLHRLPLFQRNTVLGYIGRLSGRYHQVYSSPAALTLQTGLSLLTHFLAMASFYVLGNGLGLHFPLPIYLALVLPVVLLTILPISLAGWGVRESAMVGLFLLIGADREIVLSLSVIYGLINLTASLPGLGVYLLQKNLV